MATTRRIIFFLAAAAALTWTLPVLGADEKAPTDAKALFEAKCGVCHSVDRPKGKKKTREDWEKTVNRMIKNNGARVSDDEAKAIIDYLSKNYAP